MTSNKRFYAKRNRLEHELKTIFDGYVTRSTDDNRAPCRALNGGFKQRVITIFLVEAKDFQAAMRATMPIGNCRSTTTNWCVMFDVLESDELCSLTPKTLARPQYLVD